MDRKRPLSHEKNVTGSGSVYKRGSGLKTGPVGSTGGYSGRNSHQSGGSQRRGGLSAVIVILLIIILLGGRGGLSLLNGVLDSGSYDSGNTSDITGWQGDANTGRLDTTVASGSREKRTQILGNGQDTVTIMVYMCGTDLESRSGMATSDLKEMTAATIGNNVNLIVYTGGCTQWKNNTVSSQKNQIYQIKNGSLVCLEKDMGTGSMTNPDTLTEFIKYCSRYFPANRNNLIFWDHGGGSISGYGYDEKNKNSGSMTLAGIDTALKNAGVTYDFVGFDACLMATLENAMMLSDYADYLIASEETEPGIGWYYTNWLTELSKDTSKPTIEIGKKIVDDFVDVCNQKCHGQKTTLSVIDLAELSATVPAELTDFARSTNQMIQNDEYKTVSNARYNTREFAVSSKIDQVDLVNLAQNMNTKEGNELARVLLSAVKYNRTSGSMTNAYGISIYFPYKKVSNVDRAVSAYSQIGMDSEYSRCIQEFAGIEKSGQEASGGTTSPLSSLLGSSSEFAWTKDSDGDYKLKLTEKQWELILQLDLNVFFDDGEGFIDLGLDNSFEFDSEGNLIGKYDGTWLAINNQPVAYYHTDTAGDSSNYTMTGYVPAMLNGERVEIILVFDNKNPYGYVAGARTVYKNGETDTVAKSMIELSDGDEIDFICDYYSYNGKYLDSYYLGDRMTVNGDLQISYVEIGTDNAQATYRLTDIYNQHYWTYVIP
ncbi:MAG: clostripain-related cysteine peptidase [Lachnospiraceae bacterium]